MCTSPVITSCARRANSLKGLVFPSPTDSSRIRSSRHCRRGAGGRAGTVLVVPKGAGQAPAAAAAVCRRAAGAPIRELGPWRRAWRPLAPCRGRRIAAPICTPTPRATCNPCCPLISLPGTHPPLCPCLCRPGRGTSRGGRGGAPAAPVWRCGVEKPACQSPPRWRPAPLSPEELPRLRVGGSPPAPGTLACSQVCCGVQH